MSFQLSIRGLIQTIQVRKLDHQSKREPLQPMTLSLPCQITTIWLVKISALKVMVSGTIVDHLIITQHLAQSLWLLMDKLRRMGIAHSKFTSQESAVQARSLPVKYNHLPKWSTDPSTGCKPSILKPKIFLWARRLETNYRLFISMLRRERLKVTWPSYSTILSCAIHTKLSKTIAGSIWSYNC